MKVTLIRARYHSVWEPQAIMCISSYLKAHGVRTQILDAFFESDEAILEKVAGSDIVGLSGTTPQVPHILKLARAIKQLYPHIKTVAGGFGVSLQPHLVMGNPDFDHIVAGEGEQAMLQIALGSEKQKLVSYPPMNIDDIPFADRDSINLEQYIAIAKRDEGRRVTSVVTQRGCAFDCTFCAEGRYGTIWRKYDEKATPERPVRFRGRNPKLVVQEMKQVRDKFNIEFFKTSDAETNPTRSHFINLCKEMVDQKLKVPWGCNIRVDKVDDEICDWAVRAGCQEFWMGVESASPEILQHINKGITVDMIRKAFKVSKKYGIIRRTYSFIGTPLETHDTIKKTEELIDELDPEVYGVCILCPYPGTVYYKPEFDNLDWSKIDEYSNTFWSTDNMTNEELRDEQYRLIKKYNSKLATNFNKKFKSGIIAPSGRVLDSLQQHPMRFQ